MDVARLVMWNIALCIITTFHTKIEKKTSFTDFWNGVWNHWLFLICPIRCLYHAPQFQKEKSTESSPSISRYKMVLEQSNQTLIHIYREMNQPCQFLNFFDGHDIWYLSTIGDRIYTFYLTDLPAKVADTLHVNTIFLVHSFFQAFSWCCRSLFCLPLHFHPWRRCEEPAEGHHQGLLNLLKKNTIRVFWTFSRRTPSGSFEHFEEEHHMGLLNDS